MGQETLIDLLREKLGAAVLGVSVSLGDDVVVLDPGSVRPALAALREKPFDYYHLYSLSRNVRLRLKASVPAGDPAVASLTGLWKNADWLEREIFDMFGVRFDGHPDLRRLLTYEGFEGHPLRKSYPWRLAQPRIPLKDEV